MLISPYHFYNTILLKKKTTRTYQSVVFRFRSIIGSPRASRTITYRPVGILHNEIALLEGSPPFQIVRRINQNQLLMSSRVLTSDTCFFICDVQGCFLKTIYGIEEVIVLLYHLNELLYKLTYYYISV